MGITLLGWSQTPSSSTGTKVPLGSAGGASSTEDRVRMVANVPGTLSNLGFYVDNVGTSRQVRSRKATNTGSAAANGNLVASATDSVAGQYRDDAHTDTVSSGNTFNLSFTASGVPTIYWAAAGFTADSGHVSYYTSSDGSAGNFSTDSATRYVNACGFRTLGATEINQAVLVRVPGTLGNLDVYVDTNTRATNCTLTSQISTNGGSTFSDGNLVVTIIAGQSGQWYSDTAHSDTLASGNYWCTKLVTSTGGGNLQLKRVSATVTASAGSASDIFAQAPQTRSASATTHYVVPFGALQALSNTNEAPCQFRHGFAGTISKFRAYVSANSCTGDVTLALRRNGSDVITLTLTASTQNTLFENPSGVLNFDPTDDISVSIVGGTSGSITLEWIGFTEDTAPGHGALLSNQRFFLTGEF